MADLQYADARLARLYDTFEGARDDLVPYLRLIHEFGVRSMLDVGCGTGSLALLAAATGVSVTGIDPAAASVDVARAKAGADLVDWHVGLVEHAPPGPFDLAVMTGNVAQVFLDDDEWVRTLEEIRSRLAPEGRLVFETRSPEAEAWKRWAAPFEASWTFGDVGLVRQSHHMLDVDLPYVSFRWSYAFPDGTVLDSDSTLRFRSDAENRRLLERAGYATLEVRDAPDRPGLERVTIAAPSRAS